MKKRLRISLFANLTFLGSVIFLLADRSNRRPSAAPATEVGGRPPAPTAAAAATETLPQASPEPFHWSNLEATDFPTYIANLRSIGCPEPTIRDIITADVEASIYASRREQVKLSLAKTSGAMLASIARQNLETAILQLNQEEAELVAALLGPATSANALAAEDPAASRIRRKRAREIPIAMPLVLEKMDLTELKLNDNQIAAMAEIRQEFLEQIGGPNQDPADPAYRNRWQQAQADVNDQLEALIGQSAYQTHQWNVQSAALEQAEIAAKQ